MNRAVNNAELISILDQAFATKTKEEWESHFKNFDLIWAPVNTVLEVVNDPQVVENEYLVEMEHPSGEQVKTGEFFEGLISGKHRTFFGMEYVKGVLDLVIERKAG